MRRLIISALVFVFAAHASTAQTNDDDTGTAPIADQSPQIGEAYLGDTHGDWVLRCVKTENDTDPCEMVQLLIDENDNTVAEMTIRTLPPGGQAVAGATLITPLETLLTQQVKVAVDGAQTKRYPFTVCQPQGCIARLGFTADDVAAYKSGQSAIVTIHAFAAPEMPISLSLSLVGFTAAYNALN